MTYHLEYKGFNMDEYDEGREGTWWLISRIDKGTFIDRHGDVVTSSVIWGNSNVVYAEIDRIIERM